VPQNKHPSLDIISTANLARIPTLKMTTKKLNKRATPESQEEELDTSITSIRAESNTPPPTPNLQPKTNAKPQSKASKRENAS
jgi:hypothetical protein